MLYVINDRISQEDSNILSHVTTLEVIRAVNKLKLNKQDGIFELSSNGFKEGPVELFEHIGRLVTSFIKFGHAPSKIIMCSMLPLIKDTRGDICGDIR